MKLYREVSDPEEIEAFRQWARKNYQPFTDISGLWHWIVQEECTLINQEAELIFSETGPVASEE